MPGNAVDAPSGVAPPFGGVLDCTSQKEILGKWDGMPQVVGRLKVDVDCRATCVPQRQLTGGRDEPSLFSCQIGAAARDKFGVPSGGPIVSGVNPSVDEEILTSNPSANLAGSQGQATQLGVHERSGP